MDDCTLEGLDRPRHTERRKFHRFYVISGVLWVLSIGTYLLLRTYFLPTISDLKTYQVLEGICQFIKLFGLFTIPMIVLISLPLRFAEGLLDRVAQRDGKEL